MKTSTTIGIVGSLTLLALGACEGLQHTESTASTDADVPLAPVARKVEARSTYHGVEVIEHYRWLESWDDEEVKAWSAGQNRTARAYLAQRPHREAIRERVRAVMEHESPSFWDLEPRPTGVFAMKAQPPQQQSYIVLLPSVDAPDDARVLVDPNALAPDGSLSIDWFVPSPDGTRLAVSMSRGGSERGDLHVFDVASGEQVDSVIEHVNGGTAGGTLAWLPYGSGFFYSRYPRDGSRPESELDFHVQVYFHALGTPPESDRHELGEDFPKVAEIELIMHNSTGRLLATVQDGDGGEFAHYLRDPAGRWRQFSRFGDRVIQAAFGGNDALYLLSRANAPRGKVLRISATDLDVGSVSVVVPEGEDTVVDSFWSKPSIVASDTRLFVLYQLGGPSEIRVFDLHGNPQSPPAQLDVGLAGGMTFLGGDRLYFSTASFVQQFSWHEFDGATGETRATALANTSALDLTGVTVTREFALSKDGTRVPVNLLIPPGVELDGSAPAVLTGYGGYGASIGPWPSSSNGLLLEQGVVVAVANLRGGGEYGEAWHHAGNLTKKQNVFDDFAATIDHLVARGYTSNDRLLIRGGSNGGLLMGATFVQHPEKVKAVVSSVGIYDMLRVELSPNGAFNVTEFGTVKDPDHFRALHAYSPYHHVQDGVDYPAILFTTGANDPRVDPMHSRKMTARLQAATHSSTHGAGTILLRTSDTSGHGGGKALDEQVDEMVDEFGFIYDQLGVTPR